MHPLVSNDIVKSNFKKFLKNLNVVKIKIGNDMFAMCDKSLTITIKRQAINRKEDYFRKVSWFLRAFANFFFLSKNIFETFLATFCFFQPRSSSYLANIIIDVRKKKKKFGIFRF